MTHVLRGLRAATAAVIVLAALAGAARATAGGRVDGAGGAPAPDAPISVYASVAPQAYFLERIGGERVTVGVLIGPGQDAHAYDPSPREIERLAGAELLFATGLEYEARIIGTLSRAGTQVRVIDLTEGIELRELEPHDVDPAEPHGHDDKPGDPHIWLGPAEVRIQARTMRDALASARPRWAPEFDERYRQFLAEVDAVESELAALLEPMRGRTILVYHPVFGYFTDHFGLAQMAVEAGGREPSPRQLERTIERALAAGVTVIFTQPEYDDVASRAVARAIGARTAPITGLQRDWPSLMRNIGRAIADDR